MGTNDLAKETRARITPGRFAMLPWLMGCIAAARAFGLDILDGVFNDLADAQGFARECVEARDMGFDGKTLIHPSQIAPANDLFGPSPKELADARRIVSAYEQAQAAGNSVITVDGRMIESLHVRDAQRILALADLISDMESAS
jgi:citrate lyase subunit beta / citryl-CoA lyase